MKKVSVIITTYGNPIFLEKAINSILDQSYTNLELIIVDDNNEQTEERRKTTEIVDKYIGKKVQYVCHKRNMNGSAARNTGIRNSIGDYIAFLDSDDEYERTRIEKCVNLLERQPKNVAGVYTGCEFRRNGKKYHIHKNVKTGNFLVETLACNFMFCTGSNIFVKREIIDELEGFDENFIRHQDYEFLVRLFLKYDLVGLQEVLLVKNNENFNLPNVEKMIEVKELYLNKYRYIIEKLDVESVNNIYYNQYVAIGEAALRSKKKKMSKEYYIKAKKYRKLSIKHWMRKVAFTLINIVKK